jgi:DHA1 family multidrug resistance protein-like MFS transporter
VNELTLPFPTRASRWGMPTLLADIFLMHAGFFLIIPLLSVHYVDGLGWAAGFIGVVLAVRQFTQQGLTMFGGALADKLGPRGLILAGLFIRALSFVLMGYAATPGMLLVASAAAAIGGALFGAPTRAAVAVLVPQDKITDAYARISLLQNLGLTVGPLIGAWLIRFDFATVGVAAGLFYFLAFFITWVGLPAMSISDTPNGQSPLRGLRHPLSDRSFMVYTALLIGYWFMWAQLSLSMPLAIRSLTGNDSSVGMMFTVSAVLAMGLQVPALKLLERWLKPFPILILGVCSVALSLTLVAVVQNLWQFYASLFFFALGVVWVSPTSESVAAAFAQPIARGAYFGVNSLALAVGGSVGHIVGGSLVDWAIRLNHPDLPWLVYGGVGFAAAMGLALFYLKPTTRQRLEPVAAAKSDTATTPATSASHPEASVSSLLPGDHNESGLQKSLPVSE